MSEEFGTCPLRNGRRRYQYHRQIRDMALIGDPLPNDHKNGHAYPQFDENGLEFESPLYDYLETNIPKQLMAYSDQPFGDNLPLFPGHDAVLDYLELYADEIRHLIRFHTQVVKVTLAETCAHLICGKWLPKIWTLGKH